MPTPSAAFLTRGNSAASPALTEETVSEMRGWIADQIEYPSDADGVTLDRVLDIVAQHYTGGVAGFIADQL